MTILSVFLAIFGGSLISMFKSVTRTQQTAYAKSAVNQIYLKLDRQLRYASAVSAPGTQSGDYVVEFVSTFTGTATCTQLRLSSTGLLQERSWAQDSPSTIATATVMTLGRNAAADPPSVTTSTDVLASGPFVLYHAVSSLNNQRLRISLDVQDNREAGGKGRTRAMDITFTALNTGTSSNDQDSVCSQARTTGWPSS